jgi:uncharacterized protein (DUF58 family)
VTRRYHFNLPLILFLALALVIGVVAMNSQNNLLFWIFGVLVSALLISGIVSGVMMIGLRVHRLDPGSGRVGEPLLVRYRLENRSRLFPAFNISVEDLAEPPRSTWSRALGYGRALLDSRFDFSEAARLCRIRRRREGPANFWRFMTPVRAWIMHVGPRETVHGEAVFWPLARGEARFEHLRIWTTFPFGLVRKSITFTEYSHTLIYPRLYELRREVLSAITPTGPLGMVVTPHAGTGDDYFGLREYRPGDALRHIAWKRSASLDEIICIEHTRSSPPRLRVLLDLAAPGPAGGAEAVAETTALRERAISLAASIIHAADGAGYEVGLSVLGASEAVLPVRRSRWHLGKMMSTLAEIDLDGPRAAPSPPPPVDIDRVAVVVIHPDRVTPGLGGPEAWHLTARQLDHLATAPLGWDPIRNRAIVERHARLDGDDEAAGAAPARERVA